MTQIIGRAASDIHVHNSNCAVIRAHKNSRKMVFFIFCSKKLETFFRRRLYILN